MDAGAEGGSSSSIVGSVLPTDSLSRGALFGQLAHVAVITSTTDALDRHLFFLIPFARRIASHVKG